MPDAGASPAQVLLASAPRFER